MNINEMLFFTLILVYFVTMLYQLYNIFRLGEAYSLAISVTKLLGTAVVYGMLLVLTIVNHEITIMRQLFNFVSWTYVLTWILFIVELFMYLKVQNKVTGLDYKSNYKAYVTSSQKPVLDIRK